MKRISGLGLAVVFLAVQPAFPQASQSAAIQDPQAVALLTQALNAAGGISAITAVQDFTEIGNITYFWAGQPVSGAVTVRGLGVSLFRLDAQLPEGTRSWIVTDSKGEIVNVDGTTKTIEYENALNLGGLTFPFGRIAAALTNSSMSISMAGNTTISGRQGTVVQIQQTFSVNDDPDGHLAKLNTKNYVIDAQNFALLEVQDTLYSDDGRNRPIPHEIIFSNLTLTNGVNIPYSIVERTGGQETWSLQLTSISFNTGVTASAFQF